MFSVACPNELLTCVLSSVQMKIQGQNKQMLAAACQMFMGKSEGEIAQIALETLEGHQRAIIAHLTVEVNLTFLAQLCCSRRYKAKPSTCRVPNHNACFYQPVVEHLFCKMSQTDLGSVTL